MTARLGHSSQRPRMLSESDEIETIVDRVDAGLTLLLSRGRGAISPATSAVKVSIRRAGERLYRNRGRDAMINAAMLIAVRNPDRSRNDRIALLDELWSTIAKESA
jgi:hypothetical protein